MKRRILKVWQFVLLLAMLMLIPQTMFFSVLHVDRDVAENIAEQLKDEARESIKDNVFLSIAENILLDQIPEESVSGYELMTKFPIPMCILVHCRFLFFWLCSFASRELSLYLLLQPVYMGFLVLFAAVFFCGVFPDRFYQGLNRQKIFSAFCGKKYFLWECT